MSTTRREQAILDLQASGVILGRSGDVSQLKRAILASGIRQITLGRKGQCTKKRPYTSEDSARNAARRIGNPEVRPYQCAYCRLWHNGNPPRRLK